MKQFYYIVISQTVRYSFIYFNILLQIIVMSLFVIFDNLAVCSPYICTRKTKLEGRNKTTSINCNKTGNLSESYVSAVS